MSCIPLSSLIADYVCQKRYTLGDCMAEKVQCSAINEIEVK